jgi:hypothetical protein
LPQILSFQKSREQRWARDPGRRRTLQATRVIHDSRMTQQTLLLSCHIVVDALHTARYKKRRVLKQQTKTAIKAPSLPRMRLI